MVASPPRLRQPRRGRVLAPFVLAVLLGLSLPAAADHIQADGSKSILFDHRTGNEWWVEVMLGGRDPASVQRVEAMDDGGPWTPLTKRSWGAWAASFHIEPGHRVLFRAVWPDGEVRQSCWFEHPSGVERCDSVPPSGFDASFSGVRGNEWWVQANVAANGPVSKVDVRLGTGDWKPLAKQSWGGWAASYHIVQGTVVQLRATAADGQSDLSSCRQWIPPSGQDAQVVPCPGSSAFDATFTGVKGNEWWVQANVAGNQPIAGVAVRVNCAPQWRPLALQSWGGWAASYHIPPGSKVDFQARSNIGAVDVSGGYVWTAATPTSGCPAGAWPQEGSFVTYHLGNNLCGSGNCWSSEATLQLRYRDHIWRAECSGTTRESLVDGREATFTWQSQPNAKPVAYPAPASVGQVVTSEIVVVRHQDSDRGTAGQCEVQTHTVTVQGQRDKVTSLPGNPTLRTWWGDEADPDFNGIEDRSADWETKLGLAVDWERSGRRSGMASFGGDLVDTDAPIR